MQRTWARKVQGRRTNLSGKFQAVRIASREPDATAQKLVAQSSVRESPRIESRSRSDSLALFKSEAKAGFDALQDLRRRRCRFDHQAEEPLSKGQTARMPCHRRTLWTGVLRRAKGLPQTQEREIDSTDHGKSSQPSSWAHLTTRSPMPHIADHTVLPKRACDTRPLRTQSNVSCRSLPFR